jgi:hypothetical protein
MDQTKDNKKVNYALDDRIITVKCTDGELEIPVYDAVKSQYIKNYIEIHDENKENTPLSIRMYFTKNVFNDALNPHLCEINDLLLLPKKVTMDDIYEMNKDKFDKFIKSAVIIINEGNNEHYYGTIELNNVKYKFIAYVIGSGVVNMRIRITNTEVSFESNKINYDMVNIDTLKKCLIDKLKFNGNFSNFLMLFVQ